MDRPEPALACSHDENLTTDTDQTGSAWVPNPWEPPFAGTETEHLLGALDRLRTTFRWKAGHLDAAGLQPPDRRPPT